MVAAVECVSYRAPSTASVWTSLRRCASHRHLPVYHHPYHVTCDLSQPVKRHLSMCRSPLAETHAPLETFAALVDISTCCPLSIHSCPTTREADSLQNATWPQPATGGCPLWTPSLTSECGAFQVQLSGHDEQEASGTLQAQLQAADLRRESLEKRNALLEGFIGLAPPPQVTFYIHHWCRSLCNGVSHCR